mmetsp:Transcript_16756/g.42790  ORF Transcript_16756/g.42790 Transcript_16756/m.42790 type:complete len:240 (-) Transcript_16756:328-1047(-)
MRLVMRAVGQKTITLPRPPACAFAMVAQSVGSKSDCLHETYLCSSSSAVMSDWPSPTQSTERLASPGRIALAAIWRMSSESVAEKSSDCRLPGGGRAFKIFSSAGRNPASSKVSTSSNTSAPTPASRCAKPGVPSMWSISRPGVQTSSGAQPLRPIRLRSLSIRVPPTNSCTSTEGTSCAHSRSASVAICAASSRVGAMTTAPAWPGCEPLRERTMRSTTGMRNASVLPVPVCARASKS